MDIGFIFTLIVSFAILYIGVITTYHDKKSATNKLFAGISLATVVWSFANYFSLAPTIFSPLVWIRLVVFFAVPHVVLFYFFTRNFPKPEFTVPKFELYGVSIIGVFMMVLTLTPLIFSGLSTTQAGFTPLPGKLIPLFGIFVVTVLVASIVQIVKKYIHADDTDKKSWSSMLIGFILSYTLLIVTNFILVNLKGDTSFVLYAPLFMLPSIAGTAYSILRYRLLNVKAIATEVLVFIILSITLVQVALSQTTIQFVSNSVLFCAFFITGIFLIKSVLKEVEQRERLEILTRELEDANKNLEDLIKQRESLVHLVTHKVKGSFTRSKYIFAGLLDGTFGEISEEVKKRAEQGIESDNMGIETVDLVLSVANMQKGIVKYDMKIVNLKELVEKTISEKKISVEAKGLKLETKMAEDVYNVTGDSFWLKEAINNLIENSIKYTKAGLITVGLEKKENKVLLYVKDTGVGITPEDKKNLFTEGGRGKDSVKVNVDSTGYGLYSIKLIVEAHKGRVWVKSEGEDKGSQFFVELNAV